MPTFGRPDFVAESVSMFLEQDYPHKQLIILNECPDQFFSCFHPAIEVINAQERHRTLGDARNAAIEAASGEIVFVWDDDDVHLPWRLSFGVREMLRHGAEFYRPTDFWAYWGRSHLEVNQSVPGWVNHGLTAYTKELWRRAGGYPSQTVGEDAEFLARIHALLKAEFIAYPLAPEDRFYVLRGKSRYYHTSIDGGENPLNLAPGRFDVSPTPLADALLQRQVTELCYERRRLGPADATVGASHSVGYSNSTQAARISICVAVGDASPLVVRRAEGESLTSGVESMFAAAAGAAECELVELVIADFASEPCWAAPTGRSHEGGPQVRRIPLQGEFSLGRGLNAAAAASKGDVILLCDPSVVMTTAAIGRALDVVLSGRVWLPLYQSLDRDGKLDPSIADGGGVVGLHRGVLDRMGPLPEFYSLGGEDAAVRALLEENAIVVREFTSALLRPSNPNPS
ncbi:MAG TPA: glycosyltransferase family A protein, partial [Pirellulales bacterium]